MRLVAYVSLAVLLLAAATSGTEARDDAETLNSECGAADLPLSTVDSCLERIRVLEETNPTADLRSLEKNLEAREAASTTEAGGTRSSAEAGAPGQYQDYSRGATGQSGAVRAEGDDANTAPDSDAQSPDMAEGENAVPPAEPAERATGLNSSQAQRGGMDADDEPPVEDPPDDTTPDDPR